LVFAVGVVHVEFVATDREDNVFVDDDPDIEVADDVDAVRSSPLQSQASSLSPSSLLLGLTVLNDVLLLLLLSRRLTFSRSNRCDGNDIIA